jgi:hypothetical protein
LADPDKLLLREETLQPDVMNGARTTLRAIATTHHTTCALVTTPQAYSNTVAFQAFLQLLAETSKTAHVVQFSIARWYARTSPPQEQKGAGKSGAGAFAGWVLLEDAPQDRL